ncbi:MAG: trypsin-like peptidase domain-containing protein [Rhodothermales bacterium]
MNEAFSASSLFRLSLRLILPAAFAVFFVAPLHAQTGLPRPGWLHNTAAGPVTAASDPYVPTSLSCSINVACPEGDGWENEIRSVVNISNGCTGVLVNNTRNDYTPYVLTAYHCGQPAVGQVVNWTFSFNYQSSTCADPAETPPSQSVSGAVVRAAEGDGPDLLLLELLEPIPASYNVFYAGWTIADHTPASGVVIGHPRSDIKKIAIDDDPISTLAFYWDATFDHGSIEVGSSGSPLFNENHQLIGVLRSDLGIDLDACSGPGGDDNRARILFPKLSHNWNRGAPGERLSDFLDPDGSGSTNVSALAGSVPPPSSVWINEINADTQTGTEDDEFVEIVGPPGTSLDGYQLEVYACSTGSSTLQSTHFINAFTLPFDFVDFGLFVMGGPALDVKMRDAPFTGTGTDVLPDNSGILVLKNPSGQEIFDYQYDTLSGGTPDHCPTGRTTRSSVDAPGAGTMGFTTDSAPSASNPGTTLLTASPGTQNFDGGQVLPVELVSFDAVLDGRAVWLHWETASETNNAGFEVERKREAKTQGPSPTNASDWELVSFVEGHGTTLTPQSYAHRIADVEPGRHVFRLKQIDFDGTFEYSPEVEVVVEMVERFMIEPVYPNPFNPEAQFRFAVSRRQTVRVDLYDVLGRRVKALYEGEPAAGRMQTIAIDGRGLPSGTYLIRVVGDTFAQTQTALLLK